MEDEEIKKNYTRRDFSYSSFNRSFQLPVDIIDEAVDAKYNEGVLRINLRNVEQEKPFKKRITIS